MKTKPLCMLALALALTVTTFTGCGGGGGGIPAPTASNPKLTEELYVVSGVLKETDGYAMPGTIVVTATDALGKSVKLFSDKTGGTEVPKTGIVVDNSGLASFFVDSGAKLPVTIKAIGEASPDIPNHVGSGVKFTVAGPGTTNFTINIVDMDVPAPGVNAVAHSETGVADLDDTLTKDIIASDFLSSTQVKIPAGTVFLDSNKQHLKKGVKVLLTTFSSSSNNTPLFNPAVLSYDPELEGDNPSPLLFATNEPNSLVAKLTNESELENFPGWIDNSDPLNPAYFTTAGFISVDVVDTATGKIAKNVTNSNGDSYNIRMNIASGTVDPATGAVLKVNDTIPVYTYDMDLLSWIKDGADEKVLFDTATNQLYVDHKTSHFSKWNLGWSVGKTCKTATLTMQNDAYKLLLNLSASLVTPVSGKTLLAGTKPANDGSITLQSVPNQPINIVMKDPLGSVVWQSALKYPNGVNLCDPANQAKPIIVSYTAPVANKTVPVTVTVVEVCKQDKKVRRPVPSTTVSVYTSKNNASGAKPPVVTTPVTTGTTNSIGIVLFDLIPATKKYNFSALDRRTNAYVYPILPSPNPCDVSATTNKVTIEIPVTCNAGTGSAGGSWVF
ncbi:MAG: hypothetical protein ACOYL3_12730 [Desulfuromonadaceae bacterium]